MRLISHPIFPLQEPPSNRISPTSQNTLEYNQVSQFRSSGSQDIASVTPSQPAVTVTPSQRVTSQPTVTFKSPNNVPPEPRQIKFSQLQTSLGKINVSSREEWVAWFRRIALCFIRESPSTSIQTSFHLAQSRVKLFNAMLPPAFLSCWIEMDDFEKKNLVQAITTEDPPLSVLYHILQLVEYCEFHFCVVPIPQEFLCNIAERCRAYAKALRYHEISWRFSPGSNAESLMNLYSLLDDTDSCQGLIRTCQRNKLAVLAESWYENLGLWSTALSSYEEKQLEDPDSLIWLKGRMRCLVALGHWGAVCNVADGVWESLSKEPPANRTEIVNMACAAMFDLREYEKMQHLLDTFPEDKTDITKQSYDSCLYRAVCDVASGRLQDARVRIQEARGAVDLELIASVGEGYRRSHPLIVKLQQLTELEDIVSYKEDSKEDQKHHIKILWQQKLKANDYEENVWHALLNVRKMMFAPSEDEETWVQYAKLLLENGQYGRSLEILRKIMHEKSVLNPEVALCYYENLYAQGQTDIALEQLDEYCASGIAKFHDFLTSRVTSSAQGVLKRMLTRMAESASDISFKYLFDITSPPSTENLSLMRNALLTNAEWKKKKSAFLNLDRNRAASVTITTSDMELISDHLFVLNVALLLSTEDFETWNQWAHANYKLAELTEEKFLNSNMNSNQTDNRKDNLNIPKFTSISTAILPVVKEERQNKEILDIGGSHAHFARESAKAFFVASSLGSPISNVQNSLKLLTLWYKYSDNDVMDEIFHSGCGSSNEAMWLGVLPQIFARLSSSKMPSLTNALIRLLRKVGSSYPWHLVYQLISVTNSSVAAPAFSEIAWTLLNGIRQAYPNVVESACLFAHELKRIAFLWPEQWCENIDLASKETLKTGNRNSIEELLDLFPKTLGAIPETFNELSFQQKYANELHNCKNLLLKYKASSYVSDLHACWQGLTRVYHLMDTNLSQVTKYQLNDLSPVLANMKNTPLSVPGYFKLGSKAPTIVSFSQEVVVIQSKARPRKIQIITSDGNPKSFLLKGKEDLKQAERVVQVLKLIQSLLKHIVDIPTFSVVPLSSTCGLTEWVEGTVTVHNLIRQFRSARNRDIRAEYRLMNSVSDGYDDQTILRKVYALKYALGHSGGEELDDMMWHFSGSAETWLSNRQNYTRTLACMSMIGYVLGLGDRHPSNVMIMRQDGRILHIDFGDAFELAVFREQYPEKVPFRLTRLFIKTLDISGVDGPFRFTSIKAMEVLRDNSDSILALLETFIYDPVKSWLLLMPQIEKIKLHLYKAKLHEKYFSIMNATRNVYEFQKPLVEKNGKIIVDSKTDDVAIGLQDKKAIDDNDPAELRINRKLKLRRARFDQQACDKVAKCGLLIVGRVEQKLAGTDYVAKESVENQVDRLISEATLLENLAQCYSGWCAYW
eukprot:GHVP01004900.1.p1 GENE.GHVP01004900.1~~GHVP01004900.1.p1  ORF type:complete len:1418 (+),score=212.50 GHVP01004900.1:5726-9979(+)